MPLKLAADLRPGPLDLKASVSWLECDVQCVPGEASVQATLNVGTETKPSKDAALLQAWQTKLPKSGDGLSARAWWENAAAGKSRSLRPGMELTRGSQRSGLLPGCQRGL